MRYSLTDMREMCCCGPGARTPLLMVMSHAAIYPLDLSDRGGNLHYSSVDPAKARGAIGADGAAITNLRDLEDFAAFVSLKSRPLANADTGNSASAPKATRPKSFIRNLQADYEPT